MSFEDFIFILWLFLFYLEKKMNFESKLNQENIVNYCPCGLTREAVNKYNLVGAEVLCTTEYADGSHSICGQPLARHPRESQQTSKFI